MRERVRNPIIPGTRKDRTGAGGILRRAGAEISRRWVSLARDVLAIFDSLQVLAVNDDRGPAVRYAIQPEKLASIAAELQATVARWISEKRDIAHVFWWDGFTEDAHRLGTAQSWANLAGLSEAYAAARQLEAIIYSEPYRNRIAAAKFKSYEHWTGLAAEQRSALAQVIGQAVADGQSPTVARKLIVERLEVGKAKALAYAQTDITDTLRQARMQEADQAAETMNLSIGLLWTSALIQTTRPWHASRNGRVYTTAEVREFYSQRGNRYNCRCATTECLLDSDGKPILSDGAKAKLRAEREAWEREQMGV